MLNGLVDDRVRLILNYLVTRLVPYWIHVHEAILLRISETKLVIDVLVDVRINLVVFIAPFVREICKA